MTKNGFTLAEVLISLAIIGVVASLTLPTLQVNIQKQQVGPALAKAINTLENANRLALTEGNARSLLNLKSSIGPYSTAIDKYMDWHKSEKRVIYTAFDGSYDLYGEALADDETGPWDSHTTKDGITYYTIGSIVSLKPSSFNPQYAYSYFNCYVDVNGVNKGPNAFGKDVFHLIIDMKGSVIPVGGAEYAAYRGNNTINWKTKPCYKYSSADACAGAIVDNGYKVTYY